MMVPPRHDQAKRRPRRQRLVEKLVPRVHPERGARGKVIRVREAWPIIENRDIEIELMSEWRNALRDVPRSRYPQWARRQHRFLEQPPLLLSSAQADAEIR